MVLLLQGTDEELRVKLLRQGAQDYVIKPFLVKELRARVGNLMTAKRAEEALRERIAQLAEANQELESFSFSISPDLRTPMRRMSGFTKILLEDYAVDLSLEAQRHLELIHNNAVEMAHLIEDLLKFSRRTK